MSKEENKTKMSAVEREKRRSEVGRAASEKVAKSEQINFRIEEQFIAELQNMAYKNGIPVGTMIREWVLERLTEEKIGTNKNTSKALYLLNDMRGKLNNLFNNLPQETADSLVEQDKTSQTWPTQTLLCLALPTPSNSFATHRVGESATTTYCSAAPNSKQNRDLSSGSNSKELEHLRAIEHLLCDQLKAIKDQLKTAEIDKSA